MKREHLCNLNCGYKKERKPAALITHFSWTISESISINMAHVQNIQANHPASHGWAA